MSHVVGIDLGTLNSCVAIVRDGKAIVLSEDSRTTVPSCVALAEDKELVGAPAKRLAVTHPESTVIAVKRLLGHPFDSDEVRSAAERAPYPIKPSPLGSVLLEVGGRELTPVQVSARILQRIRELAENALGGPVKRAVISVPAHFNDIQRKATKLAAEYAGIDVLRLINEPTAAAFAYGYKTGKNFTLAVYDLGGGTFDVTIMEAVGDAFSVIATDGDSFLGGEDFDQTIAQWLEAEFEAEFGHSLADDTAAQLRIREGAEKAKVELSEVEQTTVDLPFLTQLPDGERPHFSRTLTRTKLEELVGPLVQRTLELCQRCAQEAGAGAVDEVLLVGGASRMPAVRQAVAEFFGQDPRRDINPDEVVAMGAALYAYTLVADELKGEAEEAAEDAFAVALRGVEVARKLVDEVARARDTKDDNTGLADRLKELLAQTGVEDDPEENSSNALDFSASARPDPAMAQTPPDRLPAEPGSDDDTPIRLRRARGGEEDLPQAAEAIREELYALDYKACEVIEKLANELAVKDGLEPEARDTLPRLLDEAREMITEKIESAKEASEEVQERAAEAVGHAKARKVKLNDVTSLPLGIASAGDVFMTLIEQNERVPVEHERKFTTSQDGQTEVEIRAYQGRARRCGDNDFLGSFTLCGIEPGPRMQPKISVAFRIDEDGILSVRARDADTGEQQGMRIDDPLRFDSLEPDLDDPDADSVPEADTGLAAELRSDAGRPVDLDPCGGGDAEMGAARPDASGAPDTPELGSSELEEADIDAALEDVADGLLDEQFDNTTTGARELDFDDDG